MYAKSLEYHLAESCQKSDVSPIDAADVAARFESLRRYRKIPFGRENRAKALTSAQIAAAITGLVPTSPGWAGHAAIILTNLRPVGGAGATFAGATTLSGALATLLTCAAARKTFLSLSLSAAEGGTNSSGLATLTWDQNGGRCRVAFVSHVAVAQLQPGTEKDFDFDRFYARASRWLTLDRRFFDGLAAAVERAASFAAPPPGDGSE